MIQAMLVAIIAMGFATSPKAEQYKEYGKYDLRDSLKTKKTENGETEHYIDMKVLDQVIDDLASHAKNYPPTFRSKDEKNRAAKDAKIVIYLLDMIAANDKAETELLLKAGFLNSIAHNLDIKGSAQKATAYYERLLKREPNHPACNFHYGVFLAGTGTGQKKSLPYLEKALKLGVEDARFSLGLAHLTLGDKTKSLEYLESYFKKNPDDKHAKIIIEAIKSGRIEVKKKSLSR